MPSNNCENRLLSLLSAQEWHLDRLYAEYSRNFGTIFRNYNGRMTDVRKKQLQKALQGFNDDMKKTLASQINNSFGISNLCNDDFAKDYLKGLETPEKTLNKVFTTNPGAASSFLARTAGGLTLSDRVWALTQQTQEALESVLESGVLNGRSAAEIATDLKKYLKEPDRQFRRIRNDEGKLILSNPAKEYHPGRGVYRSSYKNALRLSRNEINIAYRTNDFERRKNMPFVTGQRVQLSAAHPQYDICDELVGTYPKEFKFIGWHTNCLCFTTSLLLPRDKFKEYLGGGEIDQRYMIKGVPKNALDYLNDNADKLRGYKSTPYFLRDNFKYSDGKYVPQLKAAPNQLSAPSNRAVIQGFTPAKTIQEAEQLAKNSGVDFVDFKGWNIQHANAMVEALSLVPKAAKPNYITNFAGYNKAFSIPIKGRSLKSNFGVSLNTGDLKINTNLLTPELRDKYTSPFSKILDNKYTGESIVGSNMNLVAINTKYFKNPSLITARKAEVNRLMKEKGSNPYFLDVKDDKFTHLHELGHVYDNTSRVSGKLKLSLSRWHKESKIGHLAPNSEGDYREAFADAFADYYSTGGKNLPDYLKKDLTDILK